MTSLSICRAAAVWGLALSSQGAFAQDIIAEQDGLGIELEELLSEKGKFTLELGGTFSASRQTGIAGLYETIQTGAGTFVDVPIEIGATDRQSTTGLATASLRYGLTAKSEIYTRVALRHDNSQFTNSLTGLTEQTSAGALQDVVVGLNHRFLDEGAHPALIGFADIAVLQNTAAKGSNFQSAKSGTIGFTTYRVLDPVVLSLTAGYRANLKRYQNGDQIDPSDKLFLNPSIAFAVNNELTLTGGMGINFSSQDRVNGAGQKNASTTADLQFGAAYAWDKNTTLRLDTRTETLGDNTVTLGLTLTRKLGRD